MLAAAIEYQQSAKTPYAKSTEAFDGLKEYLGSREAHKMTESDLERELNRRGKELMRQLLQGHLKSRGPGEAAGPVEDSDAVERSEQRWHEREVETTFGTVEVERIGYASEGCESLHPLDGSLNLPPELYSLEVRRQIAESEASRSFDEKLLDLARHTGAEVPKRQAEELVLRAAQDFDAFYEARREEEGQVQAEGTVLVLTFDGKGVVMHRQDLRETTRRAAQARQQHKDRLSKLFKRLGKGEKANSTRMATVGAVYTVDPFVRTPEEFLARLMPLKPGTKTKIVRPKPQDKRVLASVEKEPWQVILEGLEEAQRRDPERLKTWEHQLDHIEERRASTSATTLVTTPAAACRRSWPLRRLPPLHAFAG